MFITLNIIFFKCSRTDNSRVGGGILPKFNLIQASMHVLVTCKNEDDSIKNEEARGVTTFFHIISPWCFFTDAQGQTTPQSLIRSGRISNSFEMLWLCSLPAKKKFRSKMKALE